MRTRAARPSTQHEVLRLREGEIRPAQWAPSFRSRNFISLAIRFTAVVRRPRAAAISEALTRRFIDSREDARGVRGLKGWRKPERGHCSRLAQHANQSRSACATPHRVVPSTWAFFAMAKPLGTYGFGGHVRNSAPASVNTTPAAAKFVYRREPD